MHTVHLNTFVKLNKTLGTLNLSTKRKGGMSPLHWDILRQDTKRIY